VIGYEVYDWRPSEADLLIPAIEIHMRPNSALYAMNDTAAKAIASSTPGFEIGFILGIADSTPPESAPKVFHHSTSGSFSSTLPIKYSHACCG